MRTFPHSKTSVIISFPQGEIMFPIRQGVQRLQFELMCLFVFGEGNGNPLQYSCLKNPRDRGAQWVAVYGVTQSQTRLKRLSSSSSSLFVSVRTASVLLLFESLKTSHLHLCAFDLYLLDTQQHPQGLRVPWPQGQILQV